MKIVNIDGIDVRVDDDMYARVAECKWYMNTGRPVSRDRKAITMARFITGATKDEVVFYRDEDTTNNQRANLEVVNKTEAHARIGAKGGALSTTGGFGQGEIGRERARAAGRLGGLISRRKSKIIEEANKVYESGILG